MGVVICKTIIIIFALSLVYGLATKLIESNKEIKLRMLEHISNEEVETDDVN